MVKIYLQDEKGSKSKEYINVNYLSFLKAHFLGWLGLITIIWGSLMLMIFILSLFGL